MKRPTRRHVLQGALAAALPAPALHAQTAAPNGAERKVLRLLFNSAETSFDPARISDLYSRAVTTHIFEAPYAYDHLARPIKVRPLTAVAMPEVSDNFRTWIIRIKPGIHFADDPVFKGQRRELVQARAAGASSPLYEAVHGWLAAQRAAASGSSPLV